MGTSPTKQTWTRLRVLLVLILALLLIPAAVLAAGGPFTDDDDSVFEPDIEWLWSHGITSGCNPPGFDHFCPDDEVTRGQMAAFLHRFANDQGNTAYQTGFADSTAIDGIDMYSTVLELTGLPEGLYFVMAKGEFRSSEIMTEAHPTCVMHAGTEFDTTSVNVNPGDQVAWSTTALTYMGEDNATMHLDCRDHGELVTLSNVRMTAISINSMDIQPYEP